MRYATENEANTAWEKAQEEAEDGKVKMGEKELTATVLEGMIYSPYSLQDETIHRVLFNYRRVRASVSKYCLLIFCKAVQNLTLLSSF